MSNILTERHLDPHTIQIRQNGEGLILVANNQEQAIDQVVRCFPFSTPDRWISLRDKTGTELGILPTLDGLMDQSRSILETHLKDRYHIPTILAFHNIESSKQGGSIWHVETDDGPAQFLMRGDRSLNLSAFPRIVFTDAITRKRYAIPDFTTLDRPSQKLARTYLPMGSRHDSGRGRGRGGHRR
ncbi:MAG: DUF1854 domain-containing protein [Candidatus Latescibacteria bacterium]|jgi:hypothetical protein|nr:DUF1854 domain-containing protein [Candidatus Latescibacterota bacterium]